MDRLSYLILSTGDLPGMVWFYESVIGLPLRERSPDWVVFDTAGAALALHAMPDPDRRGVQLRFATADIDARVRTLKQRGVRFDAPGIERYPWGRVAYAWDGEDNRISLWQPRGDALPGVAPGLFAQVHCGDLDAQRRFYAETLGLEVATVGPESVEFDTDGSRIELKPRVERWGGERPHDRPIALGLVVDGLAAWCADARIRGLELVAGPEDHGAGMVARARDPQGNEVTFREAPAAETLEEELAEPFEEDGAPHQAGMRRSVKKPGAPGGGAIPRAGARTSMVSVAPRGTKRKRGRAAPRKRPSATTQQVVSVRGGGPERSRALPKRTADEKKARGKHAIGRAKKATIARLDGQKRAAASASKGKVPRQPRKKKPAHARTVRGRR